jgi:hypothetical protein
MVSSNKITKNKNVCEQENNEEQVVNTSERGISVQRKRKRGAKSKRRTVFIFPLILCFLNCLLLLYTKKHVRKNSIHVRFLYVYSFLQSMVNSWISLPFVFTVVTWEKKGNLTFLLLCFIVCHSISSCRYL